MDNKKESRKRLKKRSMNKMEFWLMKTGRSFRDSLITAFLSQSKRIRMKKMRKMSRSIKKLMARRGRIG